MKFSCKAISFALAAVVLTAIPLSASADDWKLLGTRKVSDRAETDVIHLNGHRGFRKLKVCVYRNPVNFKDFDVYFENGGHQDVAIRSRIGKGDCTRVIDLNGGERDLDRIVMRYEETSRKRASATVRVYGR